MTIHSKYRTADQTPFVKGNVFTRKEAATYLSLLIGPVSPRTLEVYDIPYRAPTGGRAIYQRADLEAWAAKRLAEAPKRTGRTRKRQKQLA